MKKEARSIRVWSFPNDHKVYSCYLQASILQRKDPIKVYLTISESCKNSYLKKVFVPYVNVLANLNLRPVLYEGNSPGIEVGLQLY